jgi:putative FmdB family regulatory protein
MPLYEFECDACGKRFEVIQKFSDPDVEVCRNCGKGPVHRLLSSPAIQFKGSGWYITDYARKGTTDSGTTRGSSEKAGGEGAKSETAAGDTGKGDATPAPKAETKSDSSTSTTPTKA